MFFIAIATLFLAYANGANDNFKGVATLYGGKVLPYRSALRWATLTTLSGSLVSFVAGTKLLNLFSGKGLVSAGVLSDPAFLISVTLGAALTVMLATIFGMPISTTHSLIGGLLGTGIASGGLLSWSAIGRSFFLPLFIGPLIAILLTAIFYWIFHTFRLRSNLESSFCLCIGDRQEAIFGTPGLQMLRSSGLKITLEEEQHCRMVYAGKFAGLNVQKIMDSLHIFSASALSFARGLNDTPKIAALIMLASFLSPKVGILLIAILMAVGGLVHSQKIAHRMSFDITSMNPGQAFTGNLVTAVLVITGSLLGLPLSTTHVACGSIFGIGLVNRQANARSILEIFSAWITTLPLAALISASLWFILRGLR